MCFCKDAFPVICVFAPFWRKKAGEEWYVTARAHGKSWDGWGNWRSVVEVELKMQRRFSLGSRCHYLKNMVKLLLDDDFSPLLKKNGETRSSQRIKKDETGLPGFWCHIRLRLKWFQRRLFMILNVHPETLGDMIQFDINLLCFFIFVQLAEHGSHQ